MKRMNGEKKMLEKVAEFDDALIEKKFFDDPSTITEEEILRALRAGTLKMEIVPMFCGSSFKNKGVQTLLDYVCAFLPSPLDTPAIVGTNPGTGAEEDRKPSEDEKTSALAFKIATDPYVGRLTFFRVYSGKVEAGSYIYNTRSGKKERVSRLLDASNKQNPVELVVPVILVQVLVLRISVQVILCVKKMHRSYWNQWNSLIL